MAYSVFCTFPALETPRLILREICITDVESIYAIYGDPQVAKYDCFTPITSLKEAIQIISRYRQDYVNGEVIHWGIALKENDLLIGTCGLGNFETSSRYCEIGYDLIQAYWNQGYMTEALTAVLTFGFEKLKLNRIEAFIVPGNTASIRVLEKLHFTHEGIVRERDFFKGKFHDGIILAILKRDFNKTYRVVQDQI